MDDQTDQTDQIDQAEGVATKAAEPRGPFPWARVVVGIVLAVVALILPFQYNPAQNLVFAQVLYLAVAAMGLNLLTGFNGQVSIGHGAFFGVGAFTSAILVVEYGWTIEATIPVAAVTAAVLGVVIGFPALRIKGLYLALITLGLSVMFPFVMRKIVLEVFEPPGRVALLRPTRQQVSSMIDSLDADQYQYFVCLLAVLVGLLVARNVIHSRAGRSMIAVRDQEVAASTVGVNVAGVKVASFALSAAYAGVAGSLSVMVERVADATNPLIYFQRSIEFLIAVVIGGTATLAGPIIGAAFLVFVRRQFQGTAALAPALLGGALMLAVYVMPDGVVGLYRRGMAWIRKRRASPPAAAPPADPSGPNDLEAPVQPTPT